MSKKETTKISKKEQRRQQLARDKRNRNLKIGIPVAVVVLGFLGIILYRMLQPDIEGVTTVASAAGAQHDDSLQIDFGGLPPMGGPHASSWQNCGIYTDPVVLPQHAIHSMEHGAVWVSYDPDIDPDQIATLIELVTGQPEVLLSPYPDQSSPIVLTVWDRQLAVDDADDERIEAFITRYRNRRGPETAASCLGGVGNPIG